MATMKLEDFETIKKAAQDSDKNWIKVGMSTCGIAAGASKTYRALEDELGKHGQSVSLRTCGCLGMCHAEPLVEVCVAWAAVGWPRLLRSMTRFTVI